MELLLIELVLWGGFFLLLWALKDGLGRAEADLEAMGLLNHAAASGAAGTPRRYSRADKVAERIGTYRDQPIYGYAEIGGLSYRFDHVCPEGTFPALRDNERCLPPDLVYVRCAGRGTIR